MELQCVVMRTYSKGGKLIRNGGRSLLNVLGVNVASKHGSRHGRRDSVELHGGRSDEIARANEFQTSLTELRGWRGRKKKRNTIKRRATAEKDCS